MSSEPANPVIRTATFPMDRLRVRIKRHLRRARSGRALNSLLLRPVRAIVWLLGLSLAASLLAVGWLNWQTYERLERIDAAVRHVHETQRAALKLTQLIGETAAPDAKIDEAALDDLRRDLTTFVTPKGNLSPASSERFKEAIEALGDQSRTPVRRLIDAHSALRQANYAESGAETLLLQTVQHDTRVQAYLSMSFLVLLPLIGLVAFALFRERIFRSLAALHGLLTRLAEGKFSKVDAAGVDELLLPLFDNFNHVVVRLDDLERAHRRRADSLEHDVRSATAALLAQHQSLARAERLAAVGELSATVAHELRNPLASIQMALGNLRSDMTEPGHIERVDLVNLEVQRMARLLNDLLGAARQSPEAKRRVKLAPLVDELLQLTRYQTPAGIDLSAAIAPDVELTVPVDGLRQALLNLLLNAVQSLAATGGSVTVTAAHGASRVTVAVTDTGAGFPPVLLRDGVRPFASGRESGTGLGLTLASRFARDLGGELRLANLVPAGARAEMILPSRHE